MLLYTDKQKKITHQYSYLLLFSILYMSIFTAHLVSSSMKGLNQQNLRATTPTGVTLSQGGPPFQLVTQLQRPRMQQTAVQQNLTATGIQRTPITIQMTASANSSQLTDLQLNFDRK